MKLCSLQELSSVKIPEKRIKSLDHALADFHPPCPTCGEPTEPHAFGKNKQKQKQMRTAGNVISVHCENQDCNDYYVERLFRG